MLDEQQFKMKADAALERLFNDLAEASDEHDFEVDFDGAIKIEFDDPPAKFVVSPNAPVRQIWVSALTKSFKLDWDPARDEFVLPDSGHSLHEVLADAVSKQIGADVTLG
jgi:iron donor protein CyaY